MRKHSFEVELANKVGIRAAVIYECLHDLCAEKARRDADYHDGLFWVKMPMSLLRRIFPYMSENTITRSIKKLKAEGLVMVDHYDEDNGTANWYATT